MRTREQRKQYKFVVKELTRREITRKYARSYLGIIWSVLNPMLSMAVTSLVFSTLFKRSINNYPVYYMTGVILWNFFTQATNNSMNALVDNKAMLFRTTLPKHIFVLSRTNTAMVNFLFVFVAYIPLIMILGMKPSVYFLLWIVDFICILLFALGIGYILAVLYVYYADIKYLYGLVTHLWHWLCALYYPVENLNPIAQQLIKANPMYAFIKFARVCTMDGQMPEKMLWIQIAAWGVSVYLLGYLVFRRNENNVMIHI